MLNKMKLKTVSTNTDAKVFITEDLTPVRYKLLMIAKHADAVDYAYTRDGRIICGIKGNKITFQSPDDLFLMLEFNQPDLQALGFGPYVLGVEYDGEGRSSCEDGETKSLITKQNSSLQPAVTDIKCVLLNV